jgi:hypothetical protein
LLGVLLVVSFPQFPVSTSETKNRVTINILVPDFSGVLPVTAGFLTPMKFIMCLIVVEVKAM